MVRRRRRKNSIGTEIMNIFIGLTFGYGVLVGGMYMFQRSLMYHPGGPPGTPAASGVPEMTPVNLSTKDGLKILSWYRPAKAGKPTLLHFHGNAGHIGNRGYKVRPYLDAGFGVLLVEYRGYGGNPGAPSEEGFYADGIAALDFLAAENVASGDIILYGESLGSGVVVYLASWMSETASAGALVLEASYTSIPDVAAAHYPFVPARWLVRDKFDSAALIRDVQTPVFIFHSRNDQVIPFRFGQRLFDAAVEPKESRWFDEGGHNGLYEVGAPEAVIDFIGRYWKGAGRASRP